MDKNAPSPVFVGSAIPNVLFVLELGGLIFVNPPWVAAYDGGTCEHYRKSYFLFSTPCAECVPTNGEILI